MDAASARHDSMYATLTACLLVVGNVQTANAYSL
jgi:hypothetical protein